MEHYLKVFSKVVDEILVRSLCSVFQKPIKVIFKDLCLVAALQIIKIFLLFTKNLYLLYPFLVILHKFATSITTSIKRIYFKLQVKQLTTNH